MAMNNLICNDYEMVALQEDEWMDNQLKETKLRNVIHMTRNGLLHDLAYNPVLYKLNQVQNILELDWDGIKYPSNYGGSIDFKPFDIEFRDPAINYTFLTVGESNIGMVGGIIRKILQHGLNGEQGTLFIVCHDELLVAYSLAAYLLYKGLFSLDWDSVVDILHYIDPFLTVPEDLVSSLHIEPFAIV